MNFIEIIGWIGSILYISAYFLLTYKIISKDKLYYLINKIAAILIILISVKKNTLQPIVINSLWLYISYLGYRKSKIKIKLLEAKFIHIISVILILISLISLFINYKISFEILAWFSVFAFSTSYFLYTTNKIKENTFHLYNFLAAITIIPKMILFNNFQVTILEVLWALFAIIAYYKSSKDDNYLTLCS